MDGQRMSQMSIEFFAFLVNIFDHISDHLSVCKAISYQLSIIYLVWILFFFLFF